MLIKSIMKKPTSNNYLQAKDHFLLDVWCKEIKSVFGDYPYLVGSCITRKDYRDVDVRLILDDKTFNKLIFDGVKLPEEATVGLRKLRGYAIAFSLWGEKVTGLPIDFQIEKMSTANKKYPKGDRQPMGLF